MAGKELFFRHVLPDVGQIVGSVKVFLVIRFQELQSFSKRFAAVNLDWLKV